MRNLNFSELKIGFDKGMNFVIQAYMTKAFWFACAIVANHMF